MSGGQQQMVSIGRALLSRPSILLLDEPSIGLAPKLFQDLLAPIREVQKERGMSILLVEQNVHEAFVVSDRVVVMNGGKIEQIGSPNDVYHHPKTRFVAGFIGSPAMNFLTCRLADSGNGSAGLSVKLSDRLSFPVPEARVSRYRPYVGREMLFGLRPEDIIEKRGDLPSGRAAFDAQLDVVEPMGMETMVYFVIDGTEVCGRVNPAVAGRPGVTMPLVADLNHMHLIDPQTDAVL